MTKIVKYINIILLCTLAITLSNNINYKNASIKGKHHYKCFYIIDNDTLGVKYNYYYDLYANEYYELETKKYIEEFVYNDDYNYYSSKEFYINNKNDKELSFDDENKIIKIVKDVLIDDKEYKNYYNFIKNYIPSNFACEELL